MHTSPLSSTKCAVCERHAAVSSLPTNTGRISVYVLTRVGLHWGRVLLGADEPLYQEQSSTWPPYTAAVVLYGVLHRRLVWERE